MLSVVMLKVVAPMQIHGDDKLSDVLVKTDPGMMTSVFFFLLSVLFNCLMIRECSSNKESNLKDLFYNNEWK